MTAHTKGPWWYGGQSETWHRVEGPPPADRDWSADHICNAFREADARLIAAAPELLEVLQSYVRACDEQNIKLGPITGAAIEAIAKATGTETVSHAGGG